MVLEYDLWLNGLQLNRTEFANILKKKNQFL